MLVAEAPKVGTPIAIRLADGLPSNIKPTAIRLSTNFWRAPRTAISEAVVTPSAPRCALADTSSAHTPKIERGGI